MSVPRKSFRTAKGTELPLLNLKGKEYLQIMHRLVWMREEHPDALIKTQLLEKGGEGKDSYYIFRAEIYLQTANGMQLVSTGHKRETVGDFSDAMEKSEMGAIGRALGVLGFGTQFAADDLDEGNRLADSPAPVVSITTSSSSDQVTAATISAIQDNTTTKKSSFRRRVETGTVIAPGNDL